MVLLSVIAIGTLWALIATTTGQAAFGVGLAFPGAGFWPWILDDGGAYCFGAPAWITYAFAAVLSHALFAFALVFWFGAGNVIAPILVWLACAAIAAMTAPTLATAPFAIMLFPALAWAILVAAIYALRPKTRPQSTPFPARPMKFPETPPSDPTTQGLMRFTLDRALQPIDQFDGFQFVDQFQTAATRYQLTQAGLALASAQAQTPDDPRLVQAQRNLIVKQTDPRIWAYWKWENAWGNFDTNADPTARDNIMYTGFLAAQIALFEHGTGDGQFSQPSALQLRSKSHRFDTDQPHLIASITRGWDASPYGLMPCEPNWIYPLCNAIGACAMKAHDPETWARHSDRFRASLEAEFTDCDGLIVPFRSSHTGLAGPRIGGAVVAASPVMFWNALFPDLAAGLWGRVRELTLSGGTLNIRKFWKVDTGDYRFSRAASLAGFAAAAAEMGDVETRDLALAALDTECPAQGTPWHRPNASTFAHFTELMARLNPGGGFATLFSQHRKDN